jgi:hypothetical protein
LAARGSAPPIRFRDDGAEPLLGGSDHHWPVIFEIA